MMLTEIEDAIDRKGRFFNGQVKIELTASGLFRAVVGSRVYYGYALRDVAHKAWLASQGLV